MTSTRLREWVAGSLVVDVDDVQLPRCVAVDLTGEDSGAPSLLMTRLPGMMRLDRGDDDALAEMAGVLLAVHATPVEDANRPREFQNWAGPGPWDVVPWASRETVWQRASDLASRPAPPYDSVFLHRDVNPGNPLWTDGPAPTITGLVDWVETSWGPADLDVAHCAKYLSMLHGPATAARFVRLYEAAGGRLAPSASERRYWFLLVAMATRGPERGIERWLRLGQTTTTVDDAFGGG